jgi:GT2 family glycosyltransferase
MLASGWKVLHIELAELGNLGLEAGYEGLYVCFWHQGIPLGHEELHASQLPLSDLQAKNVAMRAIAPAVRAYLCRLDIVYSDSRAPSGPASLIKLLATEGPLVKLSKVWPHDLRRTRETVSLVICTRNRPRQLERCLRSVFELSLRPSEILVIDNTSGSAATQRVVASFEGVRYVKECLPGLSRARNTGVRDSIGSLIAFTDDDIVLTRDWLQYLSDVFDEPHVAAASGLVFPAELRTPAQIVFEKGFGGFNQGYEPRFFCSEFLESAKGQAAPVWSICAGGNMAVRRRTFDSVGLFDERLGAGAAGCSEDSEFWYRVLASGAVCAYVPAAAVHHHHRDDLESLKQQIYAYMRGHVTALLVQFANFRHWGNLHRLLVELPLHYAEMLFRWTVCQDETQKFLLVGARGSVAGVWYWFCHLRTGSGRHRA